jgi:hypothetical protein
LKPATASTACHKTIADAMAIGFMYRIIGLCRLAGTTSHPAESVPLLRRRLWRDHQFWRGVVCLVHFAVRKQQGEMVTIPGCIMNPALVCSAIYLPTDIGVAPCCLPNKARRHLRISKLLMVVKMSSPVFQELDNGPAELSRFFEIHQMTHVTDDQAPGLPYTYLDCARMRLNIWNVSVANK